MAKNLLDLIDIDLLAYYKSKEDLVISGKVDKVDGKGLSSNDYTSDEKAKLAGIAAGAQVNTIEGIQVTGTSINPTNKIVNIPAATQSAAGAMSAADKTKLDGIATGAQVNVIETIKVNGTTQTVTGKAVDISVPTGGSSTPAMDGTAAAGTATTWAHSDHVHPHDSTKVDKVTGKGLSTNDFDDHYKAEIDDLSLNFISRFDFDDIVPPHILILGYNNAQLQLTVGSDDPGADNTYWDNLNSLRLALLAGQNIWFISNGIDGSADRWFLTNFGEENSAFWMTLTRRTADGEIDWAKLIPTTTTTMSGTIHTSSSTSNDFTDALKTKLEGIEAGAQVNVVTNASSTGSGAAQTMTVSKGSTNYTTYTKDALDTSLGLKANASSVYTKTEIDQKLVGAMNYKGTKATTAALPSSGNAQGDVWHVTADGSEWAWNGSAWEELGTALDLSGYVEESEIGLATNADIDELFT